MEKISGRRAITILAEISAGKRKATDQEKQELYDRVTGLRNWLIESKKRSPEDANKICKKLLADDVRSLNKQRSDELPIQDDLFIKRLELDFQEEQFFKDHLDDIYGSPDLWKIQEKQFLEVMNYLFQAKQKFGTTVNEEQKNHLLKTRKKINDMRYGNRKRTLSYRQWAICYNTVNEMLGSDRKILFKQIVEIDPQDEIDRKIDDMRI